MSVCTNATSLIKSVLSSSDKFGRETERGVAPEFKRGFPPQRRGSIGVRVLVGDGVGLRQVISRARSLSTIVYMPILSAVSEVPAS